ncbi:hypothetical protein O4J56_07700 [Nocardiopsis sp. RSe5-2]|uniref:Uncharacterized protein n=1 Tax=Nocardiopsis endophytica TaxID=3018445 RepID=A0ABT4U0P3_9ACTN|nr:hypothetical protein [Nocardiopsis endophytica]MDA2810518.1 hypothetical protein [Nocardiopsis endophytica]
MGGLLRAPEPAGSWEWFFDTGKVEAGFADSLSMLAVVAGVIRRHGLLTVDAVEICWEYPRGRRRPRDWRTVPVCGAVDSSECAESLLATRPDSDPAYAELLLLQAHGSGTWIDAQGGAHTESDLLLVETMPLDEKVAVDVSVYHDIWAPHAFNGAPHPELHAANAPRLAAALKEIESTLQTPINPGEVTYFGAVEGYGIVEPEPDDLDDGWDIDRTDQIV